MLDIRCFGAIGDGRTVNTTAIQAAIETCSVDKLGHVLVAGGKYVTGTLVLKDDVTLHIAAGAALLGSTNIADYSSNSPLDNL
jgi:polygalacturonase